MTGTGWMGSAAVLAMDITLGVTLVLALAALVVFTVLHRAPAAVRHLTWLCALGATLVLPLAALTVPEWRWEVRTPLTATMLPETEPVTGAAPIRGTAPQVKVTPVDSARKAAPAATAMATAPSPTPRAALSASVVSPAPAPVPNRTLPTILLGLWGMGVLLVLLRFAARLQTLRRFAARCVPYPDAAAVELLDQAAIRLAAPVGICLLQAPADHVPTGPMTWGVQQPVVVLPPGALLWPPARMRSVLLHEVAHVRRRDWAGYLLANVACAVYWFHPLAWWAAARLRAESELACDDQVLHAGIPATEYAHALVEIIKALRGPTGGLKVAISMAQGPQIEQRLRAILDPRRRRGSISPSALAVAVVLSAAVGMPAAGVRVRPAGEAGWSEPASTVEPADTPVTTVRDAKVAWGEPVGGLRTGLGWAAPEQEGRPGEILALRVRVRNTGLKPVRLSCLKPSAWDAKLDATGRVTLTPMLQGGGAVPAAAIWLAPGKECFVPGPGPRLRIAPDGTGSLGSGAPLTLAAGNYQVVAARPLMLQGAGAAAGSLFTGRLPLQVVSTSGSEGVAPRRVSPTHQVAPAVNLGVVSENRPKTVRPAATATTAAPANRPAAPATSEAKGRQQTLRSRVLHLQQQIAEAEEEIADLKAQQASSNSAVLVRRLEERIAETEEKLIVAETQSSPDTVQIVDLKQLRDALEQRLARAKGEAQVRENETADERRKRQSLLIALKLQLAEAEDQLAALGKPASLKPARPLSTPVADAALQAQRERRGKLDSELIAAETQLAELRNTYAEQHPRIKSVRDRIASLQEQRDSVLARPSGNALAAKEASLNAKLEALRQRIAALETRFQAAKARGAAKSEMSAFAVEYDKLAEEHKKLAQQLLKTVKARLDQSRQGK